MHITKRIQDLIFLVGEGMNIFKIYGVALVLKSLEAPVLDYVNKFVLCSKNWNILTRLCIGPKNEHVPNSFDFWTAGVSLQLQNVNLKEMKQK